MSTCTFCAVQFKRGRNANGIYCSLSCMGKHSSKKIVDSWLAGDDPGWTGKAVQLKPAIRMFVLEMSGYACTECGWDKRHPVDDKPLVEVDHIDGDAFNCDPGNLRVLCPNCHSMTPTYRARNKNSARKRCAFIV